MKYSDDMLNFPCLEMCFILAYIGALYSSSVETFYDFFSQFIRSVRQNEHSIVRI